jgi:hypothetical protein
MEALKRVTYTVSYIVSTLFSSSILPLSLLYSYSILTLFLLYSYSILTLFLLYSYSILTLLLSNHGPKEEEIVPAIQILRTRRNTRSTAISTYPTNRGLSTLSIDTNSSTSLATLEQEAEERLSGYMTESREDEQYFQPALRAFLTSFPYKTAFCVRKRILKGKKKKKKKKKKKV